MTQKIQFQRGSTFDWESINPVLSAAEPGYNTTVNKFKIGDGVTAWVDLPYIEFTGSGDTGWTTVSSLSNSFVSGGNAPGYRKLNNVVHLRGNVTSGTAGQTAFTLPIGYRPTTDFVIPIQHFGINSISSITIYTDGRVVPESTAGWLTSVSFPVG